MSSVTSVSTPGNSTADESKEPHDSPSDRVERLLQKYKVPMRDIGGGGGERHVFIARISRITARK